MKSWNVTYRLNGIVQTMPVFANNSLDAITYANRIANPTRSFSMQIINVTEFNACTSPVSTVASSGYFIRGNTSK